MSCKNKHMAVPVCWSTVNTRSNRQHLNRVTVAAGLPFSHVVAIDYIERAGFASNDEQVWMRSWLIGKKHRAARAYVRVLRVQFLLVERREKIAQHQVAAAERQFQDGVAIVASSRWHYVEFSVARGDEHVALGIPRRSRIALPDSALFGIGRRVEDRGLAQRVCVVSDHPTVISLNIAGGTPGQIDISFGQQESGAGKFAQWIEINLPAPAFYR